MASLPLVFSMEHLRECEHFDMWKTQAKSSLVIKDCWKIVETGLVKNGDAIINERALAL